MVALGLVDRQMTPSQTSVSPKTVDEAGLVRSPSIGTACHVRKPNSSLQDSPQACDADRRGSTPKSPARRNFGKKNYGVLPLSPSFSRYKSRTSSRDAPPTAELRLANGSFVDDAVEGKRTRGFSNLFKPRSASKTVGRGENTSNKRYSSKAKTDAGSGSLADDGNRRKQSAEQDRLEQVPIFLWVAPCQHSHDPRFKDYASDLAHTAMTTTWQIYSLATLLPDEDGTHEI